MFYFTYLEKEKYKFYSILLKICDLKYTNEKNCFIWKNTKTGQIHSNSLVAVHLIHGSGGGEKEECVYNSLP